MEHLIFIKRNRVASGYLNETTYNCTDVNNNITYTCEDVNISLTNKTRTDVFVIPDIYATTQKLLFFSLTVMIPLGIIFNVLSIVTFMSRRMRQQSSYWYLAMLGVADILVLVTEIFRAWLPSISVNWFNENIVLCASVMYLSMIGRFLSGWLIALFTLERFVVILRPLQQKKISIPSLARRNIAVLTSIGALLCIYIFFMIEVRSAKDQYVCNSKAGLKEVYLNLTRVFIVLSTFLPALIICLLNAATIYELVSFRNERPEMMDGGRQAASDRNKITVMLITVSTCFVILTTPYQVYWFYNTSTKFTSAYGQIYSRSILAIIRVFYTLNFVINFLLYNIVGTKFRRELHRILCCNKLSSNNMDYISTGRTRSVSLHAIFKKHSTTSTISMSSTQRPSKISISSISQFLTSKGFTRKSSSAVQTKNNENNTTNGFPGNPISLDTSQNDECNQGRRFSRKLSSVEQIKNDERTMSRRFSRKRSSVCDVQCDNKNIARRYSRKPSLAEELRSTHMKNSTRRYSKTQNSIKEPNSTKTRKNAVSVIEEQNV
ncbi:unnamed protein product [Owenia fusiformis]|uniref:Uncharacterized protein n=1 Tax=Owenia fusiformis TaxID=6347 RepID=A0A8J1TQ61_OWEFU|nr:unnamed protein product [Owenia fusiformis]